MTEKLLETKFCESLFSSYVAFLIMSVASQKRHILDTVFQSSENVKINQSFSVVALFFDKISFIKTDWCAAALLCRRNQLLVLHISGRFLLTASVGRRRSLMYISLFSASIPENYTTEFLLIIVEISREFLKLLRINI